MYFSSMKKVIIITGPTTSGKTKYAINQAKRAGDIEIINADSMQVYKEIPILSAQPVLDEMQDVSHRLFGFMQGDEQLSVGKWLEMVKKEIEDVHKNDKTPMIVGGSVMYIDALVHGISQIPEVPREILDEAKELLEKIGKEEFYKKLIELDSESADKIKETDKQRMLRSYVVKKFTKKSIFFFQSNFRWCILNEYKVYKGVIFPDREDVYKACDTRFINMVQLGAIEEVSHLLSMNYDRSFSIFKANGVPEISQYLRNEVTLERAIELAQQHTRNYAKRQMTWIRNRFQEFKTIF